MGFKVGGCSKDDGHHGDGDADVECGAKDEDDGDGVQSISASDDNIGEQVSLSRLHTSCRLIWLHCAVYTCPKWTFRTDRLPAWAQEAENDILRCKSC